jgi:hypothetical protein
MWRKTSRLTPLHNRSNHRFGCTPLVLLIVCVLFCIGTNLFAAILNVPEDYETIQSAIRSSDDGDTVLVQPGTYVENISFSRDIVVGSLLLTTGGKAYIDSTIIDGNQNGCVVFINSSTADAKLIGFTIQNGTGISINSQVFGGGILMIQSDAVIEHCSIRNNHIAADNNIPCGGGIAFFGLSRNSPIIRDCEIYMNSSTGYGGGIAVVLECRPTFERVIIRDNSADIGGGIYIDDYSDVAINHCAIINNTSGFIGGGITADTNSRINLINVTIAGNSSDGYVGGIILNGNVQINLQNSIIWDNNPDEIYFTEGDDPNYAALSYCDLEGDEEGIIINDNGEVDWGGGNINSDPLFLDPENGDYHLTQHSPCIDAGNPASPEDPDRTTADMGAFYFNQLIVIDTKTDIPDGFTLLYPYPNPFNSTTTITFGLDKSASTRLALYDLSGREVRTLFDGYRQAGFHSVNLSASDLSSGFYFVKLEGSGQSVIRTLSLVK